MSYPIDGYAHPWMSDEDYEKEMEHIDDLLFVYEHTGRYYPLYTNVSKIKAGLEEVLTDE